MKKWMCSFCFMLCMVLLAGCMAGGKPTQSTDPTDTSGTAVADPAAAVVQLFSGISEEDQVFRLDEQPGVEYTLDGAGRLFAQENGEKQQIFGVYSHARTVFLADVSGDGIRDFCATANLGNLGARLFMVYDVAQKQYYGLREPNAFDYFARIEDGELIVYRSPDKGNGWISQEDFVPTAEDQKGKVELKDGTLTFTSGETVVQGKCATPRFDETVLAQMIAEVRAKMQAERETEQAMYLQETDVQKELMEKMGIGMGDGVGQFEGYLELSFDWIDRNPETMLYMAVLEKITTESWDYFGLNLCVGRDPQLPDALIVCTEGRDLGYPDPEDYFAAVAAGECGYHQDTFVIRLDKCDIYRMGSEENLFAEAVK